jgi:hypothetical protein
VLLTTSLTYTCLWGLAVTPIDPYCKPHILMSALLAHILLLPTHLVLPLATYCSTLQTLILPLAHLLLHITHPRLPLPTHPLSSQLFLATTPLPKGLLQSSCMFAL